MIKVYLCSSLRADVVAHVDALIPRLIEAYERDGHEVEIFRPRSTDPSTMMETVREDIEAINACDELWLVGDYGRDCSWEMGYVTALQKPIVAWLDATNKEKFESDWMLKIGNDLNLLEIRTV